MKLERMRTKELPYEGDRGERGPDNPDGDLTREEYTRRQALLGIAGIGATGLAVMHAANTNHAPEQSVETQPSQEHFWGRRTPGVESKESKAISPDWWRTMAYATPRPLVGQAINPLELHYVRAIEPLPAKDAEHPDLPVFPEVFPPIDFGGNLAALYEQKRNRLSSDLPDYREQVDAYARLEEGYRRTWERNEIRRMNLKQFERLIEQEAYGVLAALEASYPAIAEHYLAPIIRKDERLPLEAQEAFIAQLPSYLGYLAKSITPKILMTYMATELMPSTDRAAPLLEFITKNAGVEYLERLPALGDSMLSYGPFQLTKYVVGTGDETIKGSGSVTRLLEVMGKSDLVPSELGAFSRIEDHIRAGHLLAFTNLVSTARDALAHRAYDDLLPIAESAQAGTMLGSSTVFVEQLAAAHHRPAVARTTMRKWLAVNAPKHKHSRDRTLLNYFDSDEKSQQVRTYADKARKNYVNMGTWLRS